MNLAKRATLVHQAGSDPGPCLHEYLARQFPSHHDAWYTKFKPPTWHWHWQAHPSSESVWPGDSESETLKWAKWCKLTRKKLTELREGREAPNLNADAVNLPLL